MKSSLELDKWSSAAQHQAFLPGQKPAHFTFVLLSNPPDGGSGPPPLWLAAKAISMSAVLLNKLSPAVRPNLWKTQLRDNSRHVWRGFGILLVFL